MDYIILLTVIYLCILIFQYIYIKYIHNTSNAEFNKKIKFNNENIDKIDAEFIKEIKRRIYLLESKQMTYDEWIDYNNSENIIKVYDNPYYFFVYEKISDDDYRAFSCKAVAGRLYDDLVFEDIVKIISDKLIFTKYTTDVNLIKNMYGICGSEKNIGSTLKYFWVDPLTDKSVCKQSRVFRFNDPVTNETGIIGIGLDLVNLDLNNSFEYLDKIYSVFPIFISVLSFLMSIVLYKLKGLDGFHSKPIIFLVLTNIYLLHFLTEYELLGSSASEIDKQTNINSGILSASFLVGVNIFILTTLQKAIKKDLFFESGFIFSISLILLLLATFKITDYTTINDLIHVRLSNLLVFNFAILLNGLIIINYITYILSMKFTNK